MKATEIRRIAQLAGHRLSQFQSVPQGIGPVATCDCGLGITQQRRGPGRGATLVWRLGRTGHLASDMDGSGAVRVVLGDLCPEGDR